jgi:hypothetical protein
MNVTRFILIAIIASSIDIAAEWILTHVQLAPSARIAVACVPIPGNVVLIVLVVQAIRKLDEFKKRVHFEAVVIAFLSTGVIVFIYGFLQKANALPPFNAFLIWAFMLVTYVIGYAVAIRQYT